MRRCFLILALPILVSALLISGCSRRGGDSGDDSESTVWGLQITAIESMTGSTYIESSVHADDLGTDDSAIVYVINRYPDYYEGNEIDPTYNVIITRYLVQLELPGYSPFSFERSMYVSIAASTSDDETTLTMVAVPSTLKSQLATIVDAEGGILEGIFRIRIEGKFGNGEEAYTTGEARLRITSQDS
ncbi:MAG: hypothetical protein JW941_02015 [Candidatus Coatesbacteria bacterium]|nr:hypothetical protein [Candidatus Coatesbacteria bacterium]